MNDSSDENQVIKHPATEATPAKAVPKSILTTDIGGSKIKCLLRGEKSRAAFFPGRKWCR
jgi:hypothetical protein